MEVEDFTGRIYNDEVVEEMEKKGMSFPLHLGVTEAGNGDGGRIKSAVGISALLSEGIGNTIRVSLTEDPENEIPVARYLADRYDVTSEQSIDRANQRIKKSTEQVFASTVQGYTTVIPESTEKDKSGFIFSFLLIARTDITEMAKKHTIIAVKT